jgi:hypothetical protein
MAANGVLLLGGWLRLRWDGEEAGCSRHAGERQGGGCNAIK